MKKNINKIDRILRACLVLLIALLYFANVITGTLALVLGVFSIILLITSISGWCALYALVDFSSLKKK